jgi:hypothetical protein
MPEDAEMNGVMVVSIALLGITVSSPRSSKGEIQPG